MTDRAELKEKVVAAIRDAWNNASNDGNPISYHMADAAIAGAGRSGEAGGSQGRRMGDSVAQWPQMRQPHGRHV